MIPRVRGFGRIPLKGLALALGIWLVSCSSSVVYGGGHECDYGPLWGDYCLGPHLNYRGCGLDDFGYPYFTHGMGCGIPYYSDFNGQGTGYGDFGSFTGAPSYPDTVPSYPISTSNTSSPGVRYSSAYVTPAAGRRAKSPTNVRDLGIDQEPVVDGKGAKGVRVLRVYPGTPAEKAGLRPGDVVHSTNGYVTIAAGNLPWIIANAAPEKVLKLSVRTPSSSTDQTITAQLR